MTQYEPGDIVVDTEGSDDKAVVLLTPDQTIDDWEVNEGETVADHNPDYSEDEDVIVTAFVEGEGVPGMEEWEGWKDADPDSLFDGVVENGVKFYAFPESRLRGVRDSEDGKENEPIRNPVSDSQKGEGEGREEEREEEGGEAGGEERGEEEEKEEDEGPLEVIKSGLVNQGWDNVKIDEERGVVVIEKFGEYLIHPDGTVEGDGTLQDKLKIALERVDVVG